MSISSMEYVFWGSMIFIIYTYFGYPLLIWIFSRRSKSILGSPDKVNQWPNIAIVIPVHNEEHNIKKKIDNLRSLDYPKDKLEIIFVSDGSTDKTNYLLSNVNEIKLISYSHRQGKPTALNHAMLEVKSSIVIFTDIRQKLNLSAIKFLVSSLTQNNIGAVSGELIHRDPRTHTGKNVGLYWRYEKWIRKSESLYHSTAGVTGALYAIYRCDYVPMPKDTLLDDFEVPIEILKTKKRVIFDSRAIIYDDIQENNAAEQKRKIRTLTGNYQSFMRHLWLFSPITNPIFIQFISHKVFRLLIPYALILTLVASFILPGIFYQSMAYIQLVFYGVSLAALNWPILNKGRVINLLVVFVSMNWSVLVALRNILLRKINVRWEKT